MVISPELDRKIRKALWRAAYLIAFRLYLRLPGIYFRLFAIELQKTRVHVLRYLNRHLLELIESTHGQGY